MSIAPRLTAGKIEIINQVGTLEVIALGKTFIVCGVNKAARLKVKVNNMFLEGAKLSQQISHISGKVIESVSF